MKLENLKTEAIMKFDRSQKTMIYITLIFAFVLAVISISLPVKEVPQRNI